MIGGLQGSKRDYRTTWQRMEVGRSETKRIRRDHTGCFALLLEAGAWSVGTCHSTCRGETWLHPAFTISIVPACCRCTVRKTPALTYPEVSRSSTTDGSPKRCVESNPVYTEHGCAEPVQFALRRKQCFRLGFPVRDSRC